MDHHRHPAVATHYPRWHGTDAYRANDLHLSTTLEVSANGVEAGEAAHGGLGFWPNVMGVTLLVGMDGPVSGRVCRSRALFVLNRRLLIRRTVYP